MTNFRKALYPQYKATRDSRYKAKLLMRDVEDGIRAELLVVRSKRDKKVVDKYVYLLTEENKTETNRYKALKHLERWGRNRA